ncbi:hypothetical protein UA08_02795 [Talaromyces atroroseus]|uniref:Uncharacterized protein n=1 Tax=Talaromyces atroroseus TaxID=1441469 RepID=A0A225AST5_TALAT|nr:hypothetical protein UA08_02795 [Talaromyces atroroseus]OKL62573.1 hypothetical protein UA08_02795 [Talaromyces atroroseus]
MIQFRPTRAKVRTWTQLTYISFWFSDTANVYKLYVASTGITVDLIVNLISNVADLQRYARKSNDAILGQIIGEPLMWNPLDFLDMLIAGERYTPVNGSACAFIALAFAHATVFSAIFEQSISPIYPAFLFGHCTHKQQLDLSHGMLGAIDAVNNTSSSSSYDFSSILD